MAIETGATAPDFTLFNTKKEAVTLSSFKGSNHVVLAFFPAAFTGVCEKELCTFRDALADFNNLDATVLGISVDAPFSNAAFADKNGVNFPVLSDYKREAVNAYGVALENFAGMDGYTASERAVFIVDKEGKVAYAWVGENPGVEPNYDEVKAAVQALG